MSEDKARVIKLLEEKGRDSTYKEFMEVYTRFKEHDEAIAALRRGVDRQSKTVDSGSYCENASHDYNDWWKKNDFFKKLGLESDKVFLENDGPGVLARGFAKVSPKDASAIEKLAEAIEKLNERLDALEKRALPPPGKYKL